MKGVAVVAVAILVSSTQAFFLSSQNWDGLIAGFGVNPFSPGTFASLPRTITDAVKDGWVRDKSVVCGGKSAYAGNRYTKDGDQGAMLLFDKNGYIAGIQAGIPKSSNAKAYPNPNNALHHVFNAEAKMMVVTAYFVEPATICSKGRSMSSWAKDGTGSMLAFQVGSSPSKLMRIPLDEKDQSYSKTKFVKGKCFYTMGMHYWYDMSKNMDCDKTFPAFLLYNKGKINGFGWAFNPSYSNSWRWEHPTKKQYPLFMVEPAMCLGRDEPVSTLHIYFTSHPRTNFC